MGSHAGEIRHRNFSAYRMVHIREKLYLLIKMIGNVRINNKMHFQFILYYSNLTCYIIKLNFFCFQIRKEEGCFVHFLHNELLCQTSWTYSNLHLFLEGKKDCQSLYCNYMIIHIFLVDMFRVLVDTTWQPSTLLLETAPWSIRKRLRQPKIHFEWKKITHKT